MNQILPRAEQFSFRHRPLPIPGDLRIRWRLAVILLMLSHSRGGKASLAKLHILNDAIRSEIARVQLLAIVEGRKDQGTWRLRVEPAFGRAIDFCVGEGLAEWVRVSGLTGLAITSMGANTAKRLNETPDILINEKAFIAGTSRKLTESGVSQLIKA